MILGRGFDSNGTYYLPDGNMAEPADAFVLLSSSVFKVDRTEESSKGGWVCFMTNNKWCNPKNIKSLSHDCLPNLEHLTISCQPLHLPSKLADTDAALSDLHGVLHRHQTQYPDVAVGVSGEFYRTNLKKVMLNFHQHMCAIRGEITLDHCSTPLKRGATRLRLFPCSASQTMQPFS